MEASFGRPPAPGSLGYQAAIDAGLAAYDAGATPLALSYFEQAVSLRRTSMALAQLGKCLRDLGRIDDALTALAEAIRAPGGDTRRARLTYVATLCDARRYEEALPMANQAAAEEPGNAAVLNVCARVLEELAETLSGGLASDEYLGYVRAQARDLRSLAQSHQTESAAQRQQRRRERSFPLHSIAAPREEVASIEQAPTLAVGWHLAPVADSGSVTADVPAEEIADATSTASSPNRLRRLWRWLCG